MNISRRRLLMSLGGLATALLLGCDKSSQESLKSKPLNKLRFQASWMNDAEFIGYFVSLDPEFTFFNQAGLDIEYLTGGPQVIPESSLLNGTADIALTTPETTAQYVLRDKVPFVIIGAQYQKNPVGVVSLATNPIREPRDLVGKRLAVPPANRLTVDAMLRINKIDASRVRLVPYTYDPNILISGAADATIDFVTNVPYAIRKLNREPESFLLYDFGFPIFNDLVVVYRETLEKRFEDLARFLAASMLGWEENYRNDDFERFPQRFKETRFKGTGRTVENEIDFNRNQKSLMVHRNGFFEMDEQSIEANIRSLEILGLGLNPEVFDTRVLWAKEIKNDLIKHQSKI